MAELNANWLAEAVEHSEEYKRLETENAELREQLRLANIDAVNATADANDLRVGLRMVLTSLKEMADKGRINNAATVQAFLDYSDSVKRAYAALAITDLA